MSVGNPHHRITPRNALPGSIQFKTFSDGRFGFELFARNGPLNGIQQRVCIPLNDASSFFCACEVKSTLQRLDDGRGGFAIRMRTLRRDGTSTTSRVVLDKNPIALGGPVWFTAQVSSWTKVIRMLQRDDISTNATHVEISFIVWGKSGSVQISNAEVRRKYGRNYYKKLGPNTFNQTFRKTAIGYADIRISERAFNPFPVRIPSGVPVTMNMGGYINRALMRSQAGNVVRVAAGIGMRLKKTNADQKWWFFVENDQDGDLIIENFTINRSYSWVTEERYSEVTPFVFLIDLTGQGEDTLVSYDYEQLEYQLLVGDSLEDGIG